MNKNKELLKLLPLKTERLIIRPTILEDVDLLLKMDKQEITQKYLGGIKNKTKEERIEFLKRKISKFDDDLVGSLTVCLKNGTPIGFNGISIDEEKNSAELSYIYDIDFTGNGYCSEASKKLIDTGFDLLKLDSIIAETVTDNIKSIKVLERLGFRYISSITNEDNISFNNYELKNSAYRK